MINETDLIQWQQFKVQKLKINQLYLWRASFDEWIALWAMDEGFLLLNYEFIRYNDVSIEQFYKNKMDPIKLRINNTNKPTDGSIW